jgi:hypothetical protein
MAVSLVAADKAKVVFISGKPSHGRLAHEHRAGNMILAKALNGSGLPVEAVLVPHYGYPKDASVLDDADTIVIFCTGHGGHLLNPKLKEFDELMKKGKGVVMIHWATEAIKGDPGNKFIEWMGGCAACLDAEAAGQRAQRQSHRAQGGGQWRDAACRMGVRACRRRARLWLHRRPCAHELAARRQPQADAQRHSLDRERADPQGGRALQGGDQGRNARESRLNNNSP